MYRKLDDMDFSGKRVLVRCDYNVPMKEGNITDDARIKKTFPTVQHLLDNNAKQIVLCSHLGKPKGEYMPDLTMEPVYERLVQEYGTQIYFEKEPDYFRINRLQKNKIVLLENLRFNPGEKENDKRFSEKLASFADIFVLDAFGASHRAHASVVGVAELLPSCAGRLMQKEIEMLSSVVENPVQPFNAIIGGAKADKIEVIKNLLPKVEHLIIGGILANTFLKANGIDIKGSKFDEETLFAADDILALGRDRIILPIDCVAADSFDEDAESVECKLSEIPESWLIMDIGPKTVTLYSDLLEKSKTVAWGGPIGVFEFEKFANGTRMIAQLLASLDATTVICGGDSGAAIAKYGLEDKMSHVSTGGGASLEMLGGKKLPGISALEKNFGKFR
ncbi:MAG: phosphoglycerate kinase [Nanoarchaeota archaeon]|nr:phosphoglycerate kinase [Nanoarchaeota archaeon]